MWRLRHRTPARGDGPAPGRLPVLPVAPGLPAPDARAACRVSRLSVVVMVRVVVVVMALPDAGVLTVRSVARAAGSRCLPPSW